MHWHAIRQSTRPYEDDDFTKSTATPCLDGPASAVKDTRTRANIAPLFPTGDDACDVLQTSSCTIRGTSGFLEGLDAETGHVGGHHVSLFTPTESASVCPCHAAHVCASSARSVNPSLTEQSVCQLNSAYRDREIEEEERFSSAAVHDGCTTSSTSTSPFLQVGIPTHPTNDLAPFAYQRALRNRIRDDELGPGRKYDIKAYTPMFIHDCLSLPGSLASVGGKGSLEDIIRRMTPALLPDFHAHIHAKTHGPLILQSSRPGDYVSGMLIFGQSKSVRREIHNHYRDSCKRIKIRVELDTIHPVPSHQRQDADDRWELRRRTVSAHAWIWKNASSGDAEFRGRWTDDADGGDGREGWRIEEYLAGKYEPRQQGLRIEPAGWIDDDRESVGSEESGVEDWEEGLDKRIGEAAGGWEAASVGGGAAEWNGDEAFSASRNGDGDYVVNTVALDRDYDRSGSAGFFW